MKRSLRVTVILTCTAIAPSVALQNLFQSFQTPSGFNKPSPLCQRVDLGSLSVSPMGLGTLNLPLDKETDEETTSVIQVARECGVNFVDTAEAVSYSSKLFLRWLMLFRAFNICLLTVRIHLIFLF
jgi:hypothetical protein